MKNSNNHNKTSSTMINDLSSNTLVDELSDPAEISPKNSIFNIASATKEKNNNQTEGEIKIDPTFFGDWQIKCRTIDF